MKVYFDESYPSIGDKVILGALFASDKANTYLHKEYARIKADRSITGELKYSKITTQNSLDAAIDIATIYFDSKTPFFRACILPYSATGLADVTGATLNEKRVKVYVDSGMKLILHNLPGGTKADLFLDEEERVAKTKFYNKLRKSRPQNGARVSSATPVQSSSPQTHLIQLCDLLTGAILQNLHPTNTRNGRFKKQFGQFVLARSKATSFNKAYWENLSKPKKKKHAKFAIGYWITPKI